MSKLPLSELYPLYTRHLLLKELVINDVSLYILSLLLLYKKQIALNHCEQLVYSENIKEAKQQCLSLLLELEDRFVNAVVSYKIGYCMDSKEYYYNSYNLLNKKNLTPQELYCKGAILHRGHGDIETNIDEAMKYYELSKTAIAYLQLGGIYYLNKNYEQAIIYSEKGIKLNCPHNKYFLCRILYRGLGCAVDKIRSFELCESAAKQGQLDAIISMKYL